MRHTNLIAAAVLLGLVLLLGVAMQYGLLARFDLTLSQDLALRRGLTPDWLIGATQAVSWIGGGPQRTLCVVLLALALWRYQSAVAGAALALTSLGSNLSSTALKTAFFRPRPQLVPHLDDVGTSLSYPSGHATSAAVVYLLLALLLPPGRRSLWLGLAALMAGLTGLSRIMLGVHYPSDVLGGWMLGGAFALIGLELVNRSPRGPA